MTESEFYHTILRKRIKGHWCRIETPFDDGIPDGYFAGRTPEGVPISAMVEFKVTDTSIKNEGPMNLTYQKSQLPWHMINSRHGGVSLVVVYWEKSRKDKILLMSQSMIDLVEANQMSYNQLAECTEVLFTSLPVLEDNFKRYVHYVAQSQIKSPSPTRRTT